MESQHVWNLMAHPWRKSLNQYWPNSRMEKLEERQGLLPELVRYGAELWDRMLMEKVWEEQSVVRDWKDTKIVPIPRPLSM